MITRDSRLAKLFYNYDSSSSINGQTKVNSLLQSKQNAGAAKLGSTLTLENLKLHDKMTQETNNNFLPKMNRLVQNVAHRPTTQFSGQFSIFDALYELENFGKVGGDEENKSTAAGTLTEKVSHADGNQQEAKGPALTQSEYKDQLLEQLL